MTDNVDMAAFARLMQVITVSEEQWQSIRDRSVEQIKLTVTDIEEGIDGVEPV